ncbi:MAG: cobyric acid synthase CobQ, partial [Emergencia timonensis]
TYIHGVFDKEEIARTIVEGLLAAKGLDFSDEKAFDIEAHKQTQYDILAEGLRKSLDMELLYKIVNGTT